MKNLMQHLNTLVITAWVGSLWAVGYLAVPILFKAQPDRQLAGMLAGEMFLWAGYLGMLCGGYLLLGQLWQWGRDAPRQAVFRLIIAMLLITLLVQGVIQPQMADLKAQALPLEVMHSAYADKFKMLHGISSIAYLLESLLGAALIIKSRR
ncbi:MAG: DUF4149 domain-containing protein [Pseudomonadota bacterium]